MFQRDLEKHIYCQNFIFFNVFKISLRVRPKKQLTFQSVFQQL